MTKKPKPTRTTNPLHFEDLDPHRFEDLTRQLIRDFRNWKKLEPTGRLGTDDGYDVRGTEVVAVALGAEERVWQIQCKRSNSITPKELATHLDEMLPSGATTPYGVLFVAPCDFSKRSRDLFAEELQKKGVHEFYLWGKGDLEDVLYQPKNDHLLFLYFGFSLQGSKPSFVFVVGVPLGDNRSAKWLMLVKHYGPEPAYNCKIRFYDRDRKNIEHEWLVKHPHQPYPPPGLAGQSQIDLQIPEADPPGLAGSFEWTPLDPDRQHYSVSITCRSGVFDEEWEVTRVDGVLRTRFSIEHGISWKQKNRDLDPMLLSCSDPEFVPMPLLVDIPATKSQVVHPGWKPNHKFEFPVAILTRTPMSRSVDRNSPTEASATVPDAGIRCCDTRATPSKQLKVILCSPKSRSNGQATRIQN